MKNQIEIFWRFLLLGFTSFGGPIAHLGYFNKTFVDKFKWLDEETYVKIVALSQFLPGPSSSQTGFCIGLKKGGLVGGILAFIGFTLPSFLALYLLAVLHIDTVENKIVFGIVNGLKLFAVVVVTDATLSMFRKFCKSNLTIFIFILCCIILFILQSFISQILVIVLAGTIGFIFAKNENLNKTTQYIKPNLYAFILFIAILIFGLLYTSNNVFINLFNSFYQIGSLVFGGGHVVLPMIAQNEFVNKDSFLLGYAFAQAVPGPMFSIASYLGATNFETSSLIAALTATIAIFLPGFLLILSFEKSFESYSNKPLVSKALIGINASVVAILFVALCDPIFVSGVKNILDLMIAIVGVFLLNRYKFSIFLFILLFSLYGIIA